MGTRRKIREEWSEIANRRKQDHSYARYVTIDHPSPIMATRSPEPDYAILFTYLSTTAYRSLHRSRLIRGLKINQYAHVFRARVSVYFEIYLSSIRRLSIASFTRIICSIHANNFFFFPEHFMCENCTIVVL